MILLETKTYQGLTQAQVQERLQKGLSNHVTKEKQKSAAKIVSERFFTLFNLYLIIIAIALVLVKEYLSIFFLNIMIMNVFIQSYQIIRSVRMVNDLNILIAETSQVLREGTLIEVQNDDLVLDDIIYIHTGSQIAADCMFLDDYIEMNESMITGESKAVKKHSQDLIYSGSFVSSGSGYAQVVEVGKHSYIQKIMSEARKFKDVRSDLIDTFTKVANTCAKVVGPIGIILMVQSMMFRQESIATAIVTTSTVLLGLLPKGLVLLTSISFAVSVYRLGRKQTLIQSTYAIETLSNVDVICIDKTGTLTQGIMSVTQMINVANDDYVHQILANYLSYTEDLDSTTKALQGYCKAEQNDALIQKLAFSSQRKWGAMRFETQGDVYLGAPDFLMPNHALPHLVKEEQEMGARILLLAKGISPTSLDTPGELVVLSYIVIEDALRSDASDTLSFFNQNDVVIKIISGDHIATLLAVASHAGIQKGDRAIDVSSFTTEEELEDAVLNYNVIGRASPYQKQIMVKLLQKHKMKVAMVGDGVNDVLALRSADCSIAMGAGSPAAIQISEVVLLDNEFATMVDVVMEGRAVTNNISRSASMYYLQTLIIFLLAGVSIFTNSTFPFIPIQMSIMSMFVEGMPSTLVTFEASYSKPKESVLRHIFRSILPAGLSVAIAYIILFTFSIGVQQRETMLYYATIFLSYMLVVRIFKQMTVLRALVLLASSSILIGICALFANLLNLVNLSYNEIVIVIALVGFVFIIWVLLDWLFSHLIFPEPKY